MLNVISFTFNPVSENTYVLYNDEKDCCIIDPGCYFTAEKEELKTTIEKTGLKPVLLLNTHCHLDHIFGNKYVSETWGLDLHIHPLEKPVLEFGPVSGEQWGLPFDNYAGPLQYLEPGKNIRLGKEELEVRFTPGHSPGSVSFYYRGGSGGEGFILGGDVLFNQSIGRTDLPGGSFEVLINSIQTQFLTLPDETRVYSGHGPETTVGAERRNNPFLQEFPQSTNT
jgi:glyoxylase-like metal-dependent hydrolase (beta-lactamase superfamily II)